MKRELARRAKVMEELKSSIALNKQETESVTLKWAGEKDAKAHLLAQLEKEPASTVIPVAKQGMWPTSP
jgi:hypothetical protein